MSFADDANNEETLTSAATGEVTAAVAAKPDPLTVTLENNPASHDGSADFTFELRFSEEFSVSYATLRDHAFTVTGGTVEKAARADAPSNILWKITVEPNGNGDVAIVLPVTTDCNAQGAICAGDDRRLSNRLEFTVSGPDSAIQNSPATGAPAITGTAQVGQTLAASTTGIADSDGLTNAAFTYQWSAGGTDIEDATGPSHTLTASQQGQTVQVRVSFTDDAGNAESLTSAATGAVSAKPNSPATGDPTISGTAQAGETLTADITGIADPDGLTGVSYSYQWLAGGSDIQGATGSGHTLTSSEQGKTVQVRVSFTDDAGNAESLTSAATAAVAGAAVPLTVTLENDPASHEGSAGFTFELRFSEHIADLSYKTLRDHAFTVTGGQVKKAQRMDPDSETRNIHWRITVEPDGNGNVTIVLPATTDCAAQGAICTGDGRKLSNRMEIMVPGPGG